MTNYNPKQDGVAVRTQANTAQAVLIRIVMSEDTRKHIADLIRAYDKNQLTISDLITAVIFEVSKQNRKEEVE